MRKFLGHRVASFHLSKLHKAPRLGNDGAEYLVGKLRTISGSKNRARTNWRCFLKNVRTLIGAVNLKNGTRRWIAWCPKVRKSL